MIQPQLGQASQANTGPSARTEEEVQRALRESEARYRALAMASSEVIYRMSPDWTEMNQLKGRDFLADTAEPSTSWLERYILPEDQPRVTAAIQEAIRTKGIFELEHRVLRADGSVGWTFSRAVPLVDAQGDIVEWFGAASDITERKQSEEALSRSKAELQKRHAALHASEERFRVLVETTAQAVWETGPEGMVVTDSPTWRAYTGQTLEEWLGYGWLNAVHPDDRAHAERQWREAVAGGDKYDAEYRLRNPDGGWRWTRMQAAPLHDAEGRILNWVGMNQDISERRRLEEQRQHFVSLAETSHEFIGMCDLRFKPFFVNAAGMAMVGLEGLAQAVEVPVEEFFFPEDRPFIMEEFFPKVLRDGFGEAEIRFRHFKTGEPLWMIYAVFALKDAAGQSSGYATVSRNITQRKQAEEREERLKALMDHNPSLVFMKDEAGRYCYLNRTYEAQFAFSKDWQGKTDFDFWPEASAELFRANDAAVLASGETHQFLEDSIGLDGKRYCWLCYKFPFTDARNQRFVGGIGLDVTARVLAEEALRDSDRRKDEFLALLAHELRNPLAPIRNALHVLRKAPHASGSPHSTGHLLEMMERQTSHLVRLVDDLLEVSRINRGTVELRKERVLLATVLQHAIDTSQPLIQQGGHAFHLDLPKEALALEADPVRLAQVFSNLLNNAAKFTPEGGHIWLRAERRGSGVAVSVRDNGEGIPAHLLPQVFDLFTQAHRSIDRAQGGLGLGLALVRSLVGLHGGRVEARSEGPGRGSEFIVHLPLIDAVPDDPAMREPAPPPPLRQRILVVDDNPDVADSLGLVLESLGIEVEVAYDGPAALAKLDTFRPEAILLDLGMAGMDGYETARRIRQSPSGEGIKLVALTGWGQEEDRQRTRAAGFDHHLVKPVAIEVLQALLASSADAPKGR